VVGGGLHSSAQTLTGAVPIRYPVVLAGCPCQPVFPRHFPPFERELKIRQYHINSEPTATVLCTNNLEAAF